MSMSWLVWLRSLATVFCVAVVGAGGSKVEIASSSSITAGSVFFSTKPSPCESAVISCALMRSIKPSNCLRMRGSERAPYGDFKSTSTERSKEARACSRWPSASSRSPAAKCRCDSAMRSSTGSLTGAGGGRDGSHRRSRRRHRHLDGLLAPATSRNRYADADRSCYAQQ